MGDEIRPVLMVGADEFDIHAVGGRIEILNRAHHYRGGGRLPSAGGWRLSAGQ
jgi:hypothetical protein